MPGLTEAGGGGGWSVTIMTVFTEAGCWGVAFVQDMMGSVGKDDQAVKRRHHRARLRQARYSSSLRPLFSCKETPQVQQSAWPAGRNFRVPLARSHRPVDLDFETHPRSMRTVPPTPCSIHTQ